MPDFDVTPTWVYPEIEEYNVIVSAAEDMKKEYYLLSPTPAVKYKLEFSGVSDSTFAFILSHYRDVSGPFASFNWTAVPSYIDGGDGLGVDMTGRWTEKPNWSPKAKSWDVEMIFEKDIA